MPRTVRVYDEYAFGFSWVLEELMQRTSHALVLDGKVWMTIRAEDGHGYVSVSDDGLTWAEPTAWKWDDGGDVAMSTTVISLT